MKKIIDRKGIQCSGVSFTPAMNEKIQKYLKVINNHINEEVLYVELQEYIQQETGITKSAFRVDMPFLYNSGFVIDYHHGKIKLSELFTDLGKAYIEIIRSIQKANELRQDAISKSLTETLSFIMLLSILHRKSINAEEYYLDMLKFIYTYGSINEDEFYLMVTSKSDLELIEDLSAYRDGILNIKLETNNLAYGYTKSFLKQANLIDENRNGRLILNENMIEIINKIVK